MINLFEKISLCGVSNKFCVHSCSQSTSEMNVKANDFVGLGTRYAQHRMKLHIREQRPQCVLLHRLNTVCECDATHYIAKPARFVDSISLYLSNIRSLFRFVASLFRPKNTCRIRSFVENMLPQITSFTAQLRE